MSNRKRLVLTGCTANYAGMAAITEPSIERYSGAVGAEFMAVKFPGDGPAKKSEVQEIYWRKFLAIQLALKSYDRVAWIDTDCYVYRDAPDIFDAAPDEVYAQVECHNAERSAHYRFRLYHTYAWHRREFRPAWFVGPGTKYWNSGVFSIHKDLAYILKSPLQCSGCGEWPEQNWMCLRTAYFGIRIKNLWPWAHSQGDGRIHHGFHHVMGGNFKYKCKELEKERKIQEDRDAGREEGNVPRGPAGSPAAGAGAGAGEEEVPGGGFIG